MVGRLEPSPILHLDQTPTLTASLPVLPRLVVRVAWRREMATPDLEQGHEERKGGGGEGDEASKGGPSVSQHQPVSHPTNASSPAATVSPSSSAERRAAAG